MASSRNRYAIELKYDVILKLEKGQTASDLSSEMKIPPSVICEWKKNADKIRNESENCKTRPKAKSMKKGKFPKIEEEVTKIIEDLNNRGAPITNEFIGHLASDHAEKLGSAYLERSHMFIISRNGTTYLP